jgi:predicted permease
MFEVQQDLRYALRGFVRTPAFTLVVVLTLALGIGANAAIFGLADQILLRTLPVRAPERLVLLHAPGPFSGASHNHNDNLEPLSHPMFEALRDRNQVFSGVLAHYAVPVHLTAGSDTESVSGDLVSGTFFDVLGVEPSVGRLFHADDDRAPGAHPLVVLGHEYWTRRFGSDPAVVGRGVRVNGTPMTVIGVAPRGFHGIEVGESMDLYVPLMMQHEVLPTWPRGLGDWRTRWLTVMARLKDGLSQEQALSGVNVLYGQILQEDLAHLVTTSERLRSGFLQKRLALLPGARGTSGLRDQSQTPLLLLMGMVGLVLLIACANVANLLLARASSRRKEVALRLALGASRGRLVRQLLVESLTLALAGAVAGLGVAAITGRLLLGALPLEQATRVFSARPDLRVALFALVLALVTGLAFGLVPAFQSTRVELSQTLKNESGALLGGSAPFYFRKGLVIGQVALSLLLLVGAGLFTRSLMKLRGLNPGFEPERLLTFSVDPALNGYDVARRFEVLKRLTDEVAAEPGVRSVSLAEVSLMTNSDSSSTVIVAGYQAKEGENMNPNFNRVGPGFLATLGIPLVAGRDVGDSDTPTAPRVALVNQTFARYFYGDASALGRRFVLSREPKQEIEIVGVVKDGKAGSLRETPRRFVYLPYLQDPNVGAMSFYVRSTVPPATLGARMLSAARRVDATLPVTELKTMRVQIGESLFVERLVAALAAAFGLLATLLAGIGLYGLMSYAVMLRTREIGIRVALGADRRAVLLMVVREVTVLAALGVFFGLPAGYGLGRLAHAQLFGLEPNDPTTLALATATLLLTALLASCIPALRATRVDPMVALRGD